MLNIQNIERDGFCGKNTTFFNKLPQVFLRYYLYVEK